MTARRSTYEVRQQRNFDHRSRYVQERTFDLLLRQLATIRRDVIGTVVRQTAVDQ